MASLDKLSIKINGQPIKRPKDYKVSSYNLTKSGRVANGNMTMELVAKKRKLFITYEVLDSTEVKQILDLIDGQAMFFTVTYTDNGEEKSMTAYVGEINRQLSRTGALWYWKDVAFNFIER